MNYFDCLKVSYLKIKQNAQESNASYKPHVVSLSDVQSLNLLIWIIQTTFYFWLECDEGWYGVKCSQQCVGHCRDNNTCNHVTGQCDGGCDAGWTGSFCNKGYPISFIQ